MKCLETRVRNGMKWRRYRTSEGAILTTYEVPTVVLGVLGKRRLQVELERAKRLEARKRRAARVRSLLAQKWKPAAIASEVGMSESMVRRYRGQERQR